MIIGLTGKYAAGKGTVAEVLGALGFAYHSLSDVIREELARRGIPESRGALLETGNALREAEGPAALAKRILGRLAQGDHLVDSIRNPAEVEVLRALPGFVLLGVDADPRVRFERLLARGRQGDPKTWEEFRALEGAEEDSEDPTRQQLNATFALADVVISNDGSPEELRVAVEAFLTERRA